MIGIDAYRVPYVPWHLTTVEFFEEVRDHLTEDGVLTINVGRTKTDRRLVEAMTAHPAGRFPDGPHAGRAELVQYDSGRHPPADHRGQSARPTCAALPSDASSDAAAGTDRRDAIHCGPQWLLGDALHR